MQDFSFARFENEMVARWAPLLPPIAACAVLARPEGIARFRFVAEVPVLVGVFSPPLPSFFVSGLFSLLVLQLFLIFRAALFPADFLAVNFSNLPPPQRLIPWRRSLLEASNVIGQQPISPIFAPAPPLFAVHDFAPHVLDEYYI